ncbi:phospholipid-translocating P-type ATPase [Calocera viscosa TUFC12733]|uniref:Phospholipid-transporting ATPase n=1 Tax=Calocera viscosa (strain TUFC12733) TaxID=1330018 RepID=A0A167LX49_CALVF|nr:phospholipid-translocating P-type ATPase [Calocera viscosa TUFC12733]
MSNQHVRNPFDDDFDALVSTSNPAAQGGSSSSRPRSHTHNASEALDPFFGDEEEDEYPPHPHQGPLSSRTPYAIPVNQSLATIEPDEMDDNSQPIGTSSKRGIGFGPLSRGFRGNESREQDLPLTSAAAPPAGTEPDEPYIGMEDELARPQPPPTSTSRRRVDWFSRGRGGKGWRWPWQKKVVLEGERIIRVNDPQTNELSAFEDNYVSTSKYNALTFLPKFLAEQFSKYANLFFLFTACIQQIPGVSPTNRYTTIVPLGLVLLASAFKEMEEDLKRHQQDNELNSRKTKVLQGTQFRDLAWKAIKVGDIVRLENDDFIPADMLLLSSSEPEGLCYVETSNLDGETNLKIKQANLKTAHLTSAALVSSVSGTLRSEQPNNSLYTYEGTMQLVSTTDGERTIPLSPDQLLLRGAQMRNTQWVFGLVVFGGHETKLMRNATAAPMKRTQVERQVNLQIIFLFIVLLVLSITSTVGSSVRTWFFSSTQWYLYLAADAPSRVKEFLEDILTFVILYNNLIPISLIVTMEVVKYWQAQLINNDLDLYYEKTDTPAICRTSSLVEELGQIEFVFSDKTGTLTRNEMEFRQCSIAGVPYSDVVEEHKRGEVGADGEVEGGQRTFEEMRTRWRNGAGAEVMVIKEFLTLLAVCHTVIPEMKGEKMVYQASSPDEAALVAGAQLLGYKFYMRKPRSVYVEIGNKSREFEILNVCEFNSTRKRMSVLVRGPDGKIKLYCKGADTVILERVAKDQPYTEATLAHLEDYATDGLRTLCLAMREIPEAEYRTWSAIYEQAAATVNGRGEALDKAAEAIEKDMFLLGATAIEDKLQEGVPDAIHTLQQAGIKVWVLTGDRQETAINIGLSCRLISENMNLVIVNEETAHDTKAFIDKRLAAVKSQRAAGELEDLGLVIDGKSLGFALEKEISAAFLELAIMCKAVICCRVSPLQKALVVKLVKKNRKSILLAIGDGANDVSMIQAAHVGVGISGVEGLQAARAADVSIAQFRFLTKLLLVHGAWSYQRLSKLILYSFYKNIVLYMTQFFYSFFNNFSGQIAYESWTLSYYNVIFTLLPPLVMGVFDQFVSARMLIRYPQLYHLGQSNTFFSTLAFWQWMANALFHSIILFGFSVILFWGDLKEATGYDSGHWAWGTTLYLAVLLTVLGKAALVSDLWTKYTLMAIPGSFLFTMVALPIYCVVAPLIPFSAEYRNIVPRLWTDPIFYFTILLFPFFCLSRDFAWKYYKRTYRPQPYHIAQELQKFNIPDYRPRQEQFQKAIKKVRAVQRMRKSRGFAFSQTENPDRQEQVKLVRAYDTSQQFERPTGL